MDKISVKFNEDGAGKWADNPAEPIFEVEAGDVVEVSVGLAKDIVEAKKGKIVDATPVKTEDETDNTDDTDNTPKEGDVCELEDGKEGIIKDGECVKKGFFA